MVLHVSKATGVDDAVLIVAPPLGGADLVSDLLSRADEAFTATENEAQSLARYATTDDIDAARALLSAATRRSTTKRRLIHLIDCQNVAWWVRALPNATFVYVHRDATTHARKILTALRYRKHEGEIVLEDLAVKHWAGQTTMLLDALSGLPEERRLVFSYDHLIENPQNEITALADALRLSVRGRPDKLRLQTARNTALRDKQRSQDLEEHMRIVAEVAERARLACETSTAARSKMVQRSQFNALDS
jgi:hypothetical protein